MIHLFDIVNIMAGDPPGNFNSQSSSIHGLDLVLLGYVLGPDSILEIVDQWSTRILPPYRRGWQWAMGGLQLNIVQNHKAAILKTT